MKVAKDALAVPLLALAAGALLVACSDTTNTPIRNVRRPLGIAVTCADPGGQLVDVAKCADTSKFVPTAWIADADSRGVAILEPVSGTHVDADPFMPGFSALGLGGDVRAIRARPDSREVFVALDRLDETGEPALLRLDPLAPGRPVRQVLPCPIVDFQVAPVPDVDGAWRLALLLGCEEGAGLALMDTTEAGALAAGDLKARALATPFAGRVRYVTVSADGTWGVVTRFSVPGDDPFDHLSRLDLSGPAPVIAETVSLGPAFRRDARPSENPDGTCRAGDPEPESRVLGAPAITADGGAVYLPLTQPGAVAVFDAETLERVDVNRATSGVEGSGNLLFEHLGFQDLWTGAPAVGIVTGVVPPPETTSSGTTTPSFGPRAWIALASGHVVRVVTQADETHPVPHVIDLSDTKASSTASPPDLVVDGTIVDRGTSLHSEYPSLGAGELGAAPGRPGVYTYYGIEFHADTKQGNPELELSETWNVTFEGAIPGAAGPCGALASAGEDGTWTLTDATADFCGRGVEAATAAHAADHVVLRLPEPLACTGLAGVALEYEVLEVTPTTLRLGPAFASVPLPPAGCLPERLPYEVRVSRSWTVVGSESGFLHGRQASGGACVARAGAASRGTGRAYTSLPAPGTTLVDNCPPLASDKKVEWRPFENFAFKFSIHPGCRVESSGTAFVSVVTPEERDTRLTFTVLSGRNPRSLALGGLPTSLAAAGHRLFVADAANGMTYSVDGRAMTISNSAY